MRDNDLDRGIGGLLDPGYASKEDLKKEELDRFYREHIENRKPHTAFKKPLSVSDYIPTPTLDVAEKTIVKPKKKDIEKTIATFGNPKSSGKWAEFVEKKGYTREFKSEDPTSFLSHPDQQKSLLLDAIDNAKQTDKGKYIPWYDRIEQQKAEKLNSLNKMNHFMIENSSVKHPDYPKAPPKKVTAQDINKQLIALKKTGPNYKYTSKLDQLIDDQTLHPKVKTDEYGNPESATDRIQQQDRDRKKRESNSTKKIPNGGTRK